MSEQPLRAAVVSDTNLERVARYLPANYEVFGHIASDDDRTGTLIVGQDSAGWTMDEYVIPRLASGLIGCREVPVPADVRAEIAADEQRARDEEAEYQARVEAQYAADERELRERDFGSPLYPLGTDDYRHGR